MNYPEKSIIRSDYRRSSEGDPIMEKNMGWIKGWLFKRRDVFIAATHCSPAPPNTKFSEKGHGWVCINKGKKRAWRRIIKTIKIEDTDITLCLVNKPFPKWSKPLNIGDVSIGNLIAIARRDIFITYKRITTISLHGQIHAEYSHGEDLIGGDSGLPWFQSKILKRLKVVSHSHKGLWGQGPYYYKYKKEINRVFKALFV